MSAEADAEFKRFEATLMAELTAWMKAEPDLLRFAVLLSPAGQEILTSLLAGAFTAGAKAVLKVTTDEIKLATTAKS